MVYLAPSAELRRHSTDVIVTESATTITFTPDTLAQVSPGCRHLFDEAFIRVLVRRLHAAHEALAHPRRIM
jgi:CRP-like cAMP-binding protein